MIYTCSATTPPILLLVKFIEKFKKLAINPYKFIIFDISICKRLICRAKYPRIIPDPLDLKSNIWPSIWETLKHIFSLLISLFTPPNSQKLQAVISFPFINLS